MSVVYRGERVEGGFTQRAAIKLIAVPGVMTAGLARQIQQRFEAERQIIARLEHPDICKLLDGGVTEDGVPYLVLEYVEGTDLLTYARQRPVEERIKLLARVARTVHYAHQRLVVHRDLKPSNIFVTAEGHPKLLDFGIAKTLDPAEWGLPGDRTATVLRAATPGYASPEQLRGEALTTATDIYSLGVLARQLFQDAADEDLTAIATRATRDEPGERYSSAAALAADLERHLQGLPLEARQGNLRYVAMKFVRRHKVGVVAAGVAVLFGMGFTAVTLVQKRQIERERARAASVAAFLQGLFQASDPEVNQGNIPSTRDMLDQGAEQIRSSVPDDETRLALMETMAGAYTGLGLYEKANGLYGDLVKRFEALDGGRSARLAAAYGGLSYGMAHLGKHDQAGEWGAKAVATARRLRPADAGVEAVALERHCLAYHQAAKFGDAVGLCKEAAEKARESGLSRLEQARILRNYGRALKDTSEFAAAEKNYKEALDLARKGGGERSPTVAVTLDEMGGLYFRQGRFELATESFQKAIDLQKILYPDGHLSTARTLNNLANTRATMRRYEEAEGIYKQAHVLYRKFLGEESGELATSLSNMAVTQQESGRLEEAAGTLRRVMDMHARTTGREKRPYLNSALKYANLRTEQGEAREAVRVAREVVAGMDGLKPVPKLESGFARVVLAASLIESDRAVEALEPARAGHEILSGVLQPTHWMRHYADIALGASLAASGRREEGRALLQPVMELHSKNKGPRGWRAGWVKKLWDRYVGRG
jgi:serine/threonine-protein kinase